MKRWLALMVLTAALAATTGCFWANDQLVVLKDVVVTYETAESWRGPGMAYGPTPVRKLEIGPDRIIMYYDNQRGEFVEINERLLWFRWTRLGEDGQPMTTPSEE